MMSNTLVPTRVIELRPDCWVVQFAGGLDGWTTFSDEFDTQDQAQAWERDQIDSADFGDEE
jgi:hypothetical protein